MQNQNIKPTHKANLEKITIALLICISIFLIFLLRHNVILSQGSTKVVNYTGIVRGATQRLIKLEVVDQPNDELINYLDKIMAGLRFGGSEYDLIYIHDKQFQSNLSELNYYWTLLRDEIRTMREVGYENTDIIDMSEHYFELANKTVFAAEKYSNKVSMYFVALLVLVVVVITILANLIYVQTNKELNKKAYIDSHTKLPNKNRCIEIINDNTLVVDTTGILMLDLNGLKRVNDTLGHLAGDTLIQNFASIVRKSIPAKHFMGRFGGDEFIVIISNTSNEEVQQIITKISDGIEKYNSYGNQLPLSYSLGFAMSNEYKNCSLQTLLEQADANMYATKQIYHKEHSKNASQM